MDAIEIRAVPIKLSKPHPKFLNECSRALGLCKNITSFKCTVVGLPSMLRCLSGKPRLNELLLRATSITTDQAEKLKQLDAIRILSLECASWNIMNVLADWAGKTQSLTSLTLYVSSFGFTAYLENNICQMITDLNEWVLEAVLSRLPRLTTLNVVGCHKIDYITMLRLVPNTPMLESLAFTIVVCTMRIFQSSRLMRM